jgi:hypothetical protein
MAGKPKTYDPDEVKIYIGPALITDFGTDTFIKVSRAESMRTAKVGVGGNVTVNKNHNNTGMVEITLMNNSGSNAILNGAALLDTGFPLAVVDMNESGDLGASTAGAWVENLPDFERAKEVGECTWSIFVSDVNIVYSALASVAEAAQAAALALV